MIISPNILGYGGLLPFVGLATGSVILPPDLADMARAGLMLYGAIILSFLGGLHWGRLSGHDVVNPYWLVWSVMPSLWGWSVLWLTQSASQQGLLLSFGLLICWLVDRRAIAKGLFAHWMGRLRRDLTIVAIISLIGAVVFGSG